MDLKSHISNLMKNYSADDGWNVVHEPYDFGGGSIEASVCRVNEFGEQIEKVIITGLPQGFGKNGKRVAEIKIRKLSDWRSGGFWNKQEDSSSYIHY